MTHENASLMFDASHIAKMSEDTDHSFQKLDDCLRYITCRKPTIQCYSDGKNRCRKCPGTNILSKSLTILFDDYAVQSITYKVWRTTDQTTLKTEELSCDEFILEFCELIEKLKVHDFISKKQSEFIFKT